MMRSAVGLHYIMMFSVLMEHLLDDMIYDFTILVCCFPCDGEPNSHLSFCLLEISHDSWMKIQLLSLPSSSSIILLLHITPSLPLCQSFFPTVFSLLLFVNSHQSSTALPSVLPSSHLPLNTFVITSSLVSHTISSTLSSLILLFPHLYLSSLLSNPLVYYPFPRLNSHSQQHLFSECCFWLGSLFLLLFLLISPSVQPHLLSLVLHGGHSLLNYCFT